MVHRTVAGGRTGRRAALAAALIGLVLAGAGLVPAIASDANAGHGNPSAKKRAKIKPAHQARKKVTDNQDHLIVRMAKAGSRNDEDAVATSVGGRRARAGAPRSVPGRRAQGPGLRGRPPPEGEPVGGRRRGGRPLHLRRASGVRPRAPGPVRRGRRLRRRGEPPAGQRAVLRRVPPDLRRRLDLPHLQPVRLHAHRRRRSLGRDQGRPQHARGGGRHRRRHHPPRPRRQGHRRAQLHLRDRRGPRRRGRLPARQHARPRGARHRRGRPHRRHPQQRHRHRRSGMEHQGAVCPGPRPPGWRAVQPDRRRDPLRRRLSRREDHQPVPPAGALHGRKSPTAPTPNRARRSRTPSSTRRSRASWSSPRPATSGTPPRRTPPPTRACCP